MLYTFQSRQTMTQVGGVDGEEAFTGVLAVEDGTTTSVSGTIATAEDFLGSSISGRVEPGLHDAVDTITMGVSFDLPSHRCLAAQESSLSTS